MFTLSERSKENRKGVDQKLIEIDDLAITLTLVDFGHGPDSGLRTVGDQMRLYRSGMSPKCDGITVRSKHQDGRALDFYAFVDGKASWKEEHLAMVAAAYFQAASILGYRIKWGGLWPRKDGGMYGWDMPHIELIDD